MSLCLLGAEISGERLYEVLLFLRLAASLPDVAFYYILAGKIMASLQVVGVFPAFSHRAP